MSNIQYKYMPVSVFDVAKLDKSKIRNNHWKESSRSSYSAFPFDVAEWCAEYFLRDANFLCRVIGDQNDLPDEQGGRI